jgi:hypothetical protein
MNKFILFTLFIVSAVLADDFIDGVLAKHNAVRAKFGLTPLKWDPASAQVAQNYADVSFLISLEHET